MPNVVPGVGALVSFLEVELVAAVVQGIGVMIRHALTPQVVQGALNDAGNGWRAGFVESVGEGFAGVRPGDVGAGNAEAEQKGDCEERSGGTGHGGAFCLGGLQEGF